MFVCKWGYHLDVTTNICNGIWLIEDKEKVC